MADSDLLCCGLFKLKYFINVEVWRPSKKVLDKVNNKAANYGKMLTD